MGLMRLTQKVTVNRVNDLRKIGYDISTNQAYGMIAITSGDGSVQLSGYGTPKEINFFLSGLTTNKKYKPSDESLKQDETPSNGRQDKKGEC